MKKEILIMPAISEKLDAFNQEGLLSAKQLAKMLRIHSSSAYRYLSGETDPTWDQVCTIFQNSPVHCGPAARLIQSRLLDDLAEGSGWVFEYIDADRDINGDGVVTTEDVFDGALKVNKKLAEMLLASREEQKHGMRTIGPVRAAELSQSINDSIRHLLEVRQVVSFLSRAPRFQPSRRIA